MLVLFFRASASPIWKASQTERWRVNLTAGVLTCVWAGFSFHYGQFWRYRNIKATQMWRRPASCIPHAPGCIRMWVVFANIVIRHSLQVYTERVQHKWASSMHGRPGTAAGVGNRFAANLGDVVMMTCCQVYTARAMVTASTARGQQPLQTSKTGKPAFLLRMSWTLAQE